MQADYAAGEEFSYVQFVGLEGNGMFATVDVPKLGLTFELPVYMIQGSEDLVTRPEVAKRYFDRIVAPRRSTSCFPAPTTEGKVRSARSGLFLSYTPSAFAAAGDPRRPPPQARHKEALP